MLGELNEKEMDDLMRKQVTGRLGCHADGTTYIVPVNYTYDGRFIYAHSAGGMKIAMMRKNPEVCFEVDEIDTVFRWKSVIAWGRYEEIDDITEKQRIMQSIIHRVMPPASNPADHPSHGITPNESDIGTTVDLIIYRIAIKKKTGRYER